MLYKTVALPDRAAGPFSGLRGAAALRQAASKGSASPKSEDDGVRSDDERAA